MSQPASAPQRTSIAPATGVGTVHLAVTDRARAVAFYRDVLGLDVLDDAGDRIRFGAGGREVVVLHPGAERRVPRGATGLYHLALVVPSRREFARFVARTAALGWPDAPTDHVMTKADYVWDPDGNGIEVYAETPEDGTWTMSEHEFGAVDRDGNRRSGRDPIDLEALFAGLQPGEPLDAPMPPGTRMGHVHLHVRDVDEAVRFYGDLVGFDVMGVSHGFGVAFLSAGGYHHHLGLNTWAGPGAPPPQAGAAGLRRFTVEVPTDPDLAAVADRLGRGGVPVEETATGIFAADPSGNRMQVVVRAA